MNKKFAIVGLSSDARALIYEFEKGLRERLAQPRFKPTLASTEEMLTQKYGVTDIDKAYKELVLREMNHVRDNRQKIINLFDEEPLS